MQSFPFENHTVQCKSLSQTMAVLNELVFVYLTFLRNFFLHRDYIGPGAS